MATLSAGRAALAAGRASRAQIGVAIALLALGACHEQQAAYTLGGAITGLTTNGLVIANGSDSVAVAANATSFALPIKVAAGATYALIVQTQPSGLTCSFNTGLNVAGSSGDMPAANLTTTAVTCAPDAYTLGGSVSGLTSGTLVLKNAGQAISLTANGSFEFPNTIAYGTTYSVQVQSKPVGLACTVGNGTGTMPAGAVSNIIVTCATSAHTIGGSISGLTAPDLVLLDNGGDATTLGSGATSFTMPTAVADGAGYDITIGAQPYGINLSCAPSNNAGSASANVTSVQITCTPATPAQTQIASVTATSIAMDSQGNLLLADATTSTVWKITYSNGSYGAAQALVPANPATLPEFIAIDSHDNIFVADPDNNIITEYFSSTDYTTSTTLNIGAINAPYGMAFDSNDNLFIADGGTGVYSSFSGAIWEYSNSGGSYGSPVAIITGLNSPTGVAFDASDNLFVVDLGTSTVTEWANGNYTAGTTLPFNGLSSPWGITVDKSGDVFVSDYGNNVIRELPYSAGAYASQITLGSDLSAPYGIAVNSSGRLLLGAQAGISLTTPAIFMFAP